MTASELITMFIRQAEERGRVRGGAEDWWRSVYLTPRQADWFLSTYEREQEAKYGRRSRSPWGRTSSLIVGDLHCIWSDRFRSGILQIELQSIAATEARNAAERTAREAEEAAWAAEQEAGR